MEQYPESVPAIDWAKYKQAIPGNLVDNFQKEYESLKVPYPPDTVTSIVKEAVSITGISYNESVLFHTLFRKCFLSVKIYRKFHQCIQHTNWTVLS